MQKRFVLVLSAIQAQVELFMLMAIVEVEPVLSQLAGVVIQTGNSVMLLLKQLYPLFDSYCVCQNLDVYFSLLTLIYGWRLFIQFVVLNRVPLLFPQVSLNYFVQNGHFIKAVDDLKNLSELAGLLRSPSIIGP